MTQGNIGYLRGVSMRVSGDVCQRPAALTRPMTHYNEPFVGGAYWTEGRGCDALQTVAPSATRMSDVVLKR